jgi:hypothetical protein
MKKYFHLALLLSFLIAPALFVSADENHKSAASTLTGCLNGPTDEGTFILKRVKAGDVHVGGIDDLKDHVGQQVKLRGIWVKNAERIGEKENTVDKVGNKLGRRRSFRVMDVEKISESCDVVR